VEVVGQEGRVELLAAAVAATVCWHMRKGMYQA
jgi:hypothetical protein